MKRRYKLIIMLFISFILTAIIYLVFHKDTNYYIQVGNAYSINDTYDYSDYLKDKYSFEKINVDYNYLEDLIDNDNFYQQIKKAEFITINLNSKELYKYKNIDDNVINKYFLNLNRLLIEIKKINNCKLYVINAIKPIDDNIELLKIKINYIYYEKNSFEIRDNLYINYKGQKEIYKKLIVNQQK